MDRDQICNRQQASLSADPEDGITTSIEDSLNERRMDNRINSWRSLWRLLFPLDTNVPEAGMFFRPRFASF